MSQQSLEIFPELILPLDSIASTGSINLANFSESAGSINLANFSESAGSINLANYIESAGSINLANYIESEGSINLANYIESEGSIESANYIESAGSINSANFSESAGSINSANFSESEGSIESANYIESAGSINLANFSESAGSINLANYIESEEIIGSEAFIGSESEAFLTSEGFFTSEGSLEGSLDSELSPSEENSLALQYSESTGNPIFFQETNLEDSLTSINPISLQETTAFDPLTGMANNLLPSNIFSGSTVNTLSQAGLSINLSTGIPNHALVTTTVKVELSPMVKFFLSFNLLNVTLQSNVWGIDGPGWFQGGADDYLFGFSDKNITGDGTYSFSQLVPKSWLNEDTIWPGNYDDEIQGRFKLVSSDNAFPLNLQARTGIIRGYF